MRALLVLAVSIAAVALIAALILLSFALLPIQIVGIALQRIPQMVDSLIHRLIRAVTSYLERRVAARVEPPSPDEVEAYAEIGIAEPVMSDE